MFSVNPSTIIERVNKHTSSYNHFLISKILKIKRNGEKYINHFPNDNGSTQDSYTEGDSDSIASTENK